MLRADYLTQNIIMCYLILHEEMGNGSRDFNP